MADRGESDSVVRQIDPKKEGVAVTKVFGIHTVELRPGIEAADFEKLAVIMKITFENEKFVHEIVPNYNGTQQHYWLIDTENHFNSIIDGTKWKQSF